MRGVRQVRSGVSTAPHEGQCPVCGAATLTGWADGLRVRADATRVDPIGEFKAIMEGRETYMVAGGELALRYAERITPRDDVYVQHRCPRGRSDG
jgi:hypothetical protein